MSDFFLFKLNLQTNKPIIGFIYFNHLSNNQITPIDPTDDDVIHMWVHTKAASCEAVDKHMQAHQMSMLLKKAKEQAQAQAQMQAQKMQPPQQPGQPGQEQQPQGMISQVAQPSQAGPAVEAANRTSQPIQPSQPIIRQ